MSQNQGIAASVQARAQEVAKEDFQQAKDLVNDATKSGAYLYPIKGIFYFLTHRSLWKPLLSRIGPTLALSVGVTVPMFIFTYVPQLTVLVFVNGPVAVFTTVLLILSESSTIISVISRNFLLQEALLDTFDGTLVAKGATNIVQEGRELQPGFDPIAKLGKIVKSPFERFSPKALVRYFMYLPLNFIPVVGTIIFILIQGRNRGQSIHDRYFQLKSWSASRRRAWLHAHTGAYSAFGVVATLLEIVPVASMFFSFTNAVGAALWAADLEAQGTQATEPSDQPASSNNKDD
ncbi:hypothetical protein MGG_02641 [Pyricularia oryzae 70-15]|uniref:Outer spore wall protein RRT8 n=3 Tax=Pyricularia oryzae TaxID=318829 RepID=G4NJI7_PYRO7|nr:uncharacterized protein MGG_02641 [Pyricularia oryzae 70-15]EHA46403.1 hypothetical protein MGG_02641 [Pyricularia oryzae 70-15]ELQ36309.1 hypothetical protein OOU_Y34scaffold00666g170 [Pyricularia oryzae Y34]KAI7929894.1 hypothetical protein M9X92_001012 [Pyricularia oryzae]KAI7930501.1 hypothetical protein M0657_001621 [Pyricularia oryzae]